MHTDSKPNLSFNPRQRDGSLKPGIVKAFCMKRNLNIHHLQTNGFTIRTTSGESYIPIFDFPLSSLTFEQYSSPQKVICSCQTLEDGSRYAVIRLYKEQKPAVFSFNQLVVDTLQNLNKMQGASHV